MTTIAEFTAQLIRYVAHDRGRSLEDATAWVLAHLIEARTEYRMLGAPLGDTDEGFLRWLQPRPQPPTA